MSDDLVSTLEEAVGAGYASNSLEKHHADMITAAIDRIRTLEARNAELEKALTRYTSHPLSRSESRRLAHVAPGILEQKWWGAIKDKEAAEALAARYRDRNRLLEEFLDLAAKARDKTKWHDVCGEYVPTYPALEMVTLFKLCDALQGLGGTDDRAFNFALAAYRQALSAQPGEARPPAAGGETT